MKSALLIVMSCLLACASIWAQARGGQQAPAAPPAPRAPGAVDAGFDGSAYAKAREIPARIVSLSAEPASIKPGQTFNLVWHTENPSSVTIDPEPGRVTPRGSRQLKPSATTTYLMTVRGPANQVLTKEVTVTVAGTTPLARPDASAAGGKRPVPRFADGKPDLSGVFGAGGGGGGRGAGGAGAPAGPVLKAGAEKYRIVRGPTDTGASANCMPLIPPQSWGVPYQFQILQGANYVAIFHEYPGTFRIIPTDGGPHPVDPDPSWLGDSVGRWEGDTLVVDTIGFNDKTELQGYTHTEDLHMVERFTRVDMDTIQYEATIEDKNVFEKPWTITRNFALRSDLRRIDEFICENNRDYRPLFGTAK
jgi:hypothetical protein